MRIFILDDQPCAADDLAWNLRAAGFDATGFFNAEMALGCITDADILVTDYFLPGTTGLEVARKAYDQGWRGAVILATYYPRQIKESLDHPLVRMGLLKPLNASELIEIIAPLHGEIANGA